MSDLTAKIPNHHDPNCDCGECSYLGDDPVDCPFCTRTLENGSSLSDHLYSQHFEDWMAPDYEVALP